MKASIFVKNLDGRIFEFDNTLKCTLNIAKRIGHTRYDNVEENDVIYIASPNKIHEVLVVVHKASSEEQAHFIIQTIFQKIKDKSDLFLQRKAIKKIKGLDRSVLGMIEKDIRNNYFEISIEDILKIYKAS